MRMAVTRLGTVAIAVLLVLLSRERLIVVSAPDSQPVAWGATDPTWSPDGTRLAFSLFGSIWQVSAGGGEAEQITASSGYHAHPRWSPVGDKVVFIKGAPPSERIPNISGKLTLVDVSTGREQELSTPYPTAGTPAWSPDGSRIACGLQVPNAGSLLYEISVPDGKARQIQYRPQYTAAGSWIDAAWDPKQRIFFATQRSDAQEVWTIPAGDQPVRVQMPLTKYRADQIVLFHSISAMPDGSGIIYSADEVNRRGNYELYRIGAQGGEPTALTNTERDEFAPSVSPDGRRIAFVSNQLGNIDLFTMTVSGGVQEHVRIADLRFRRPSGRLRVQVRDELGEPSPVRLYVQASDGKAYCPSGSPMYYYDLRADQSREGFFLGSGDDTFPVPAGTVRLVAIKGIEYEIEERSADVAAGETTTLTIQMRRWTNWAQRGWQTGENHFHLNYNGVYYLKPAQALQWLQAEDMNSASMKVANEAGAFIHDKEFFRGAVDPVSTPRYLLYWGQEYRNSFPLGHMAFLSLKQLVAPSFTSVPGSSSPYDFPLNTMAALRAHEQGALVSYVHPNSLNYPDVFDTRVGAKEMPVGTALGAVDIMDILPFGEPAFEVWYRFLNSGFRISPGAGTDAFTNYRGINRIPGSARQYVEVGPMMNWDRWIERLRQGRDFVTNGPLLVFTVNAEPMGSVLKASGGQPYRASLAVEVTSRVPFNTVEFIQNGQVIARKNTEPDARTARLEAEVMVDRSCWFAARVTGPPLRGPTVAPGSPMAHSAAIYVDVDGSPTLIREDLELMNQWIDRLWALLEERNNFGPGSNREQARSMIERARRHYQEKLAQAH